MRIEKRLQPFQWLVGGDFWGKIFNGIWKKYPWFNLKQNVVVAKFFFYRKLTFRCIFHNVTSPVDAQFYRYSRKRLERRNTQRYKYLLARNRFRSPIWTFIAIEFGRTTNRSKVILTGHFLSSGFLFFFWPTPLPTTWLKPTYDTSDHVLKRSFPAHK